MTVHFTSVDGTRDGRASPFHHNAANAQTRCASQNSLAKGLGITIRYEVVEIDDTGILSKDIRD